MCVGPILALALAACQPSAERANEAYAGHGAAFQAGEMDRAHALILAAIAERDDVADYWLALGRTEIRREDLNAAFAAYQRALELDRRSVEAIQALAEISLLADRYDDAARYADQLLTLNPSALGGVVVKGFVALEADELGEATRLADAAIALNPDDEGSVILKARTLAAAKTAAPAIALLERRVARGGGTLGLLSELKTQYQAVGDTSGLNRTYQRLIALDPADLDIRLEYAALLFDADQSRAAIAVLSQGLAARRSDPDAAERIVAVLENLGGTAVTPQDVQRLADAFQAQAKVPIARYAAARGYASVAQQVIQPFVGPSVTPTNAEAMAVRAMVTEQRGMPAAALEQAEQVLAFDPANRTALRVRTRVSMAAGRTEQALRDALKLVNGQPDVSENRVLLARVYARRGQTSLASRAYREAYRVNPRNPQLVEEYLAFLKGADDLETARWLTQDFEKGRMSDAAPARGGAASAACQTPGACEAS